MTARDDLREAVARAISDVPPRLYFVRRLLDKSGYEVVFDTDPDGPIGDNTFKQVFVGTEGDCVDDAARLIGLARADAALSAARPFIATECAKVAKHLNGWGSDCGRGGHAEHIARVIKETIR
jgi:hypothetical protein